MGSVNSPGASEDLFLTTLHLGVVAGRLGEACNVTPVARAAEEAGFELLGLGDNQSLWRDVYVSLTLAAEATSKIRLGPCVTNLVTRNVAVTTSAIATVDEVSGGRAFLGIGPGDSAVYNVGARPARLAEVEAGVESIRAMLSGQEVGDGGHAMHVRWSDRKVPIYVAAEGPKGLAMASRVADGAFASFGLTDADIHAAEQHIRTSATAAGRDPHSIEVWHAARVTVGASAHEAMQRARSGMASVAHHALRLPRAAGGVPDNLIEPLEELSAKYRTGEHAEVGDTFNARLVEDLGLLPYLSGRYGLVGTPAQCAQRVSELSRSGVRRLLLMFSGLDLEAQIQRWGYEVMPLAGIEE
jgi:5,10-methylenetetrahydromethanopterin reductase